jgi:hypothetical protein
MTIGSLYIKPMGVALMFVPFILAFLSVWLHSVSLKARTAGYVSNASRFAYWLFIATILSIVVTCVAGLIDPQLSLFNKNGLWFLVVLAILFFLCYYIIAFKPVDADQLEEAKNDGSPFFEVVGLTAAGVAGGLSGTLSWTLKMLAKAPIDIVRRSGNTIWYRQAGVGSYLGNITAILIPLVVVGIVLAFIAMYFLLIIVILSWVLVVYKFIKNLIYIKGPRL